MKQVILLAGIGGQGVQMLGKLLAFGANAQGLHVTMDAKYSGNMRGAPSNCTVILSDRPIGNPVERRADHLIAFTPEALAKLSSRVVEGGTIWYDSTQASTPEMPENIRVYTCPATRLAEELGAPKCANIVMAGYVSAHMEVLDAEVLRRCLEPVFSKKPEFAQINRTAFDCGRAWETE